MSKRKKKLLGLDALHVVLSKVMEMPKAAPFMGEGSPAHIASYFRSPFDSVAEARAVLMLTFDVISGKPVFESAQVTTCVPKPAFGKLHLLPIKVRGTSAGLAIREIHQEIQRNKDWAWVLPLLNKK
jgi:hypothetical protein